MTSDVVPAATWAWLLTEVEEQIAAAAADPCDAAVGVCLHGPPAVRSAAQEVVRSHGDAPPPQLLGELCDRLATARGDRMGARVAAIAGGSGDPAPLSRLRDSEAALADAHDRARAALRVGAAGSWLLLSPLPAVATGATTGATGWAAAFAAVGLWWLARRWLRAAVTDVRVLAGPSLVTLAGIGPTAAEL